VDLGIELGMGIAVDIEAESEQKTRKSVVVSRRRVSWALLSMHD